MTAHRIPDQIDDPLACDTFRFSGRWSRADTRRLLLHNRAFRPLATLRWCQRRPRGLTGWLARKAHALACQLAGVDLPATVMMGPGLSIQHGWGLVINGNARIGRNVTLLHGVTIGAGSRVGDDGSRDTGYPVLCDGVTVGPNAAIVGGVTIGESARTLLGAVIHFDVPAHAMAGGNPGKIVRENVPEDIWNKIAFPESASGLAPTALGELR